MESSPAKFIALALLGFAGFALATDLPLDAPALQAFLDFSKLDQDERDTLLAPQFVMIQFDHRGRADTATRNQILANPGVLPDSAQAVTAQLARAAGTASLLAVTIVDAEGNYGWLLISTNPGKVVALVSVTKSQTAVADGMFELGERTDRVRLAVGNYFLHIATNNQGRLRGGSEKGLLELSLNHEDGTWQWRSRREFLAYVAGRDGITRIAAGKRISGMQFLNDNVVKVDIERNGALTDHLILVADGDDWQVAFHLH